MANALAGISRSDHVADYVNAFRAGQGLATSRAGSSGSLDQLTNAVTGRLALADPAYAARAARRADLLGAIGLGLSGVTYAQRPAILAHLAPVLEQEGIPANTVTSFDPTDEALSQAIDQAHSAKALLGAS